MATMECIKCGKKYKTKSRVYVTCPECRKAFDIEMDKLIKDALKK